MMKITYILFFAGIIVFSEFKAQNLVPNHSFEGYIKLPTYVNQGNRLKYWLSNKNFSYYHLKSEELMQYLNSDKRMKWARKSTEKILSIKPVSGNAFISFSDNEDNVLYIKLTQALIQNHWYVLTYYINNRLNEKFDSNRRRTVYFKSGFNALDSTIIELQKVKLDSVDTKKDWIKITGKVQAKGNENYLFIKGGGSKTRIFNGSYRLSLFIVDDIVLEPINPQFHPLNAIFQTESICFEPNSSKLHLQSYIVLNDLFEYLITNEIKINISGHTDDIGDKEYNKKLSEERAKAVFEYLTEKGIDEMRLNYVGCGCEKPLMQNNSEENRSKNRRVEIKIID